MDLILLDHAVTEYEKYNQRKGHIDVPLSPQGHQKAQNLAEKLKEEKITAIYTSDLSRTYQTALPIAQQKELKIHQEMYLRDPLVIPEKNPPYPILPFHLDYQETNKEFLIRIKTTLTKIRLQETGTVLVILHGRGLRLFCEDVLNRIFKSSPEDSYQVKTVDTGPNFFQFDKESNEWIPKNMNPLSMNISFFNKTGVIAIHPQHINLINNMEFISD